MSTTGSSSAVDRPSSGQERKVSLGTIPDFAYSGKGFRLSGVVPGSPAEKAGFRDGDVITAINAKPVESLKDFSDILKTVQPGDKVAITFLRESKEMSVEAEVTER